MKRKFLLFSILLLFLLFVTAKSENTLLEIYSPGKHLTFLDQKFNTSRKQMNNYRNKKLSKEHLIKHFAESLAECRNLQPLLNHALKKEDENSAHYHFKFIEIHNLFESYLIANLLGLESDKDAEFFAVTLERALLKMISGSRQSALNERQL